MRCSNVAQPKAYAYRLHFIDFVYFFLLRLSLSSTFFYRIYYCCCNVFFCRHFDIFISRFFGDVCTVRCYFSSFFVFVVYSVMQSERIFFYFIICSLFFFANSTQILRVFQLRCIYISLTFGSWKARFCIIAYFALHKMHEEKKSRK